MPTQQELQIALLQEATNDIRALFERCIAAGHQPPVIFVADLGDPIGADFAQHFVNEDIRESAKAVRDGGVRADAIGTMLHPMSFDAADAALSRMNETGASLKTVSEDGSIVVVVVAFGGVTPYKIAAE